MSALEKRGDACIYGDASHSANLPRLRNWLTAEALHWGADVTLWLDSDVGGDVNELISLIDSPHPFIGAAPQCRPKTWNEQPRVAFGTNDGQIGYHDDGTVSADYVPSACLKVHSNVFKALAEQGLAVRLESPVGEWPAIEHFRNYWWYHLTPKSVCKLTGERLHIADGEDWYLCDMVRDHLGIQPLLDPKIRLTHHEGRTKLTVSFWDLYGQALETSRGEIAG